MRERKSNLWWRPRGGSGDAVAVSERGVRWRLRGGDGVLEGRATASERRRRRSSNDV